MPARCLTVAMFFIFAVGCQRQPCEKATLRQAQVSVCSSRFWPAHKACYV